MSNELDGQGKIILIEQSDADINALMQGIRITIDLLVVVLLSSDDPQEELRVLSSGADDCVLPDRGAKIVRERIIGVMRRAGMLQRRIAVGKIEIEPATFNCWVQEKKVILTPKEFGLLEYLMRNKEQVLSRENILTALWGFDYEGDTRTVDTVIKQLRRKLGSEGDMIRSVYGVGYRFTIRK